MTALYPATIDTITSTNPAQTGFTDLSIASATGASETVAAANTSRLELVIHNYSNNDWWIDPLGGTAAPDAAGNIKVPRKGGTLVLNNTDAVTGIASATTPLTVHERDIS